MAADCIFCRNGDNTLQKNEAAYAVLSWSPATPGHFLAVPFDHAESFAQLSGRNLSFLFSLIESTYDVLFERLKSEDDFLAKCYEDLFENPPLHH